MAKQQKTPAVVAELGRPETPEETAARKARDSRLYRQRKTVNNLVFSLLVSLGLVLVMFLMVPRGVDQYSEVSVDVPELASQAEPSAGIDLVAPEVPEGWKAKQAELRYSDADGVSYWYIGYTTADEQYAAVVQAFSADGSHVSERWISEHLEEQEPTGEERMGGFDWVVYDHPDRDPDRSNVRFGMRTSVAGSDEPGASVSDNVAVLVYGTDTAGTIRALASSVAKELP